PVAGILRPPSQSQPPEIKQEVKHEPPPRPPADKEEAARKRTFGDLVDLTAEDSDDEPPPKKIQASAPNAVNGFAAQQLTILGQSPNQAFPHNYMYKPSTVGASGFSSHMSTFPAIPPGGSLAMSRQNEMHQAPKPPVIPSQPMKSKRPTAEQQQHARLKG